VSFHLARILTPDEGHDPNVQPDDTKRGWLQVVYKGGIRFARPCYMWGSFTPPTTLWLEKFADKFGVWVTTESGSEFMERENHLVYVGFDPYEDTLPQDILDAFPEKKLAFTDRWEAVVDDGSVDPSFLIRYKGDPDNDVNPHPAAGTIVFKISQKDGEETIDLARVSPGGTRTDIRIDKSQVRISLNDSEEEIILRTDELIVLLSSGDGLTVKGKDADAVLTLGDGAVHAAIVEKLETLWGLLKTAMDAFDAHVHPTGMGPSGPPSPISAIPAWDTAINSTKVEFPDG